jgi:hypothetical protein
VSVTLPVKLAFSDPRDDLGGELGVGNLLDGFASRDALLERLGVVELFPHLRAGRRDAKLAMHFHWVLLS